MAEALKILAVDDNPSIRESMRFIFAESRYRVTGAEDGDEALATLELNPQGYDVIIVDQKMPQMSGIELVQRIKERGILGKIMVLSAHLSAEIREAFKRMDVQTILAKPFDIQELRLAVDRLAA